MPKPKKTDAPDPEIVNATFGDEKVRGFWIGEPHRSCFVVIDDGASKRRGMKTQLSAEATALDAIREALKHPVSAPRQERPRAAGSKVAAPKAGSLAWYRSELARAEQRIALLESERKSLLHEKARRDAVLLDVLKQPERAAKNNNGPRTSRYASEHAAWRKAAVEELAQEPNRSDSKLVSAIIERTRTDATRKAVGEWLQANRSRLGAVNRWV